jgi:hypothetical protein
MTLPNDPWTAGPAPPAPEAYEGASQDAEEAPEPVRRRPRLTPLRVTLTIALAGALAVVAYGLIARDATQVPMLTAGEFMTGVVFGLLALAGAWAAFSRARDGESGRALLYAVLGGVAALMAAGAFAAATIQTLILSR